MIRLAKTDLTKKSNLKLEKKTPNQFRKPPKTKRPNSPNPLNYEIVDPQEGLVPLFNSPFYATPDTPADPTDCDRYPDSPWCGGNPFDLRPVALDVDLVLDGCNFGVQFSGTLGFIKLPPLQIVWRNPDCIEKEPPLPPLPDPEKGEHAKAYCANGNEMYSVIASSIYGTVNDAEGNVLDYFLSSGTSTQVWADDAKKYGQIRLEGVERGWIENNSIPNANRYRNIRYEKIIIPWRTQNFTSVNLAIATKTPSGDITYITNGQGITLLQQFTSIALRSEIKFVGNENWYDQLGGSYGYITTKFQSPISPPPPEPPPPPKEECCKMGCCPDNSDLERLLRLILKKIGSDDLPASVPKLLTKKDAGTIQIQNLAQYVSYSVKQLDALSGKYPLEIKIKDSDLTQEGDQEKKVSLPNIAEALAEIMGILLTLQSESNANLIATTNSMIEAGSAKQSAILAADYSRGNAEYLGYKGKQVEKDVPFTFKPGEPRLDQMLKGGQVKVKSWENDDKEDLNDALAPILELAAMWKAANFKNLGTGDTLNKLKEFLSGAVDLSKSVDGLVKDNPPVSPDPSKPIKNEWDSFIEEAEQGFIAQPGITNTTDPYSRPLAQRPKIREIGNDTSDVEDQE